MINGHGDDIHKYSNKILSNFSSNIPSKQDFSKLHEFLCSNINKINNYPEPDAISVKEILAKKHNLKTSNFIITNGATEAIYLLAQFLKNSTSSILIPTFSEYEDACIAHNHKIRFIKNLNTNINTQNVWICNPNNPTGKIIKKDILSNIIDLNLDKIFILDQSYSFFTTCEQISPKEIIKKNIISINSLTKKFGIPGLRLGYIIANEKIIKNLRQLSMPWNVNSLAIECAKFLISEQNNNILDINYYLKETQYLKEEMSKIKQIEVLESNTHIVLCKTQIGSSNDLKKYLITNHGILIRDASNFRGLNKNYFRIATQSRDENDNLVNAIKLWINTY